MKYDLARETYKAWRNQIRKSRARELVETREKIDDPQSLDILLHTLVTSRDWKQGIAEGTLFTEWKIIVGEDLAAHTTPITLLEGVLTIQTSSTAWATQLKLISPAFLQTIRDSAPGALVESLKVLGPNTPTWKKGLRTIRGARGPRDTYG